MIFTLASLWQIPIFLCALLLPALFLLRLSSRYFPEFTFTERALLSLGSNYTIIAFEVTVSALLAPGQIRFCAIATHILVTLSLGIATAGRPKTAFPHVIKSNLFLIYLLLFIVSLYATYGLYFGLSTIDELAYHGPQAVCIATTGQIFGPETPLPWAAHYPKGAAIMWAWSMFFTGGDFAFHLQQIYFVIQLLLGIYVTSKNFGANQHFALLGGIIVLTMPIVFKLATTATADIPFCAAVVSIVAFGTICYKRYIHYSIRLAILLTFFSCGAAMKFPFVALVPFIFYSLSHLRYAQRNIYTQLKHWPFFVLASLSVALSTVSYLHSWITHGNPLYPLELRAFGRVLLSGSFSTDRLGDAHSTFGKVLEMSIPTRYYAAFLDWFAPLNEDSLGSFGPQLAIAVFLAPVLFGYLWRKSRLQTILAAATLLLWLLLPGFYIPRYGLPFGVIVISLLSAWLSNLPHSLRRAFLLAILLPITLSTALIAKQIALSLSWGRHINNGAIFSTSRLSMAPERVQVGFANLQPCPRLITILRHELKSGTTLAWNVSSFPILLYNVDYSNEIRFSPASLCDFDPLGPGPAATYSQDEVDRWLERIHGNSHVLVYSRSQLASALAADKQYQAIFTDYSGDTTAPMTLFRSVRLD